LCPYYVLQFEYIDERNKKEIEIALGCRTISVSFVTAKGTHGKSLASKLDYIRTVDENVNTIT